MENTCLVEMVLVYSNPIMQEQSRPTPSLSRKGIIVVSSMTGIRQPSTVLMINPEIPMLDEINKQVEEGCLSSSNQNDNVARHEHIKLKYFDGNKRKTRSCKPLFNMKSTI
jgi:hypothetical protein